MIIQLNHNSGIPVFKQVIEQVTFFISAGIIKPGQELPSVRNLAEELGVNRMTISKAYGFLEHDRLLIRRPGKSLIVRELAEEELARNRRQHLEKALSPALHLARQLGCKSEELTEIVRNLYQGETP